MLKKLSIASAVGLLLFVISTLPMPAVAEPPTALDLKARLWAERELPPVLDPVKVPDATEPAGDVSGAFEDWTRIAFQSYRDENWEIYLAWGDGTHQTRLTNHPASDMRPRLNHGATKIVFESNRDGNWEIYSMTATGAAVTRLTNHPAEDTYPAWSRDGNRIAFASDRDGNYEIYAMNSDGSGLKRLTSHSADDAMPAWSPDGSKIAWIRFVPNSLDSAIWVMNSDGTDSHALTSARRFLQHPVWSLDGAKIACDVDTYLNDGFTEPALVNADGTGFRSLFAQGHYMNDYWMGNWSPDTFSVILSRVQYVAFNEQLYIYSATIEHAYISGGGGELIGGPYNMMPDWQSTDASPPGVTIEIPRYTTVSDVKQFFVKWLATDDISGVRGYDVEYWVDGAWHTWLSNALWEGMLFTPVMGKTYVFRVRARDYAGNVSAWVNSGPVTPYAWMITGEIRDARDRPIPRATLVGNPPFFTGRADAEGRYVALTGSLASTHQVTATHAGYIPSAATTFSPGTPPWTNDVEGFNPYLSAAGNRIENGDFQTMDLSGWDADGVTVSNVISEYYTGGLGAVLGAPIHLDVHPLGYRADQSSRAAHVGINSAGTLHTLYFGSYIAGADYRSGLYFEDRLAKGQWTAPQRIADNASGYAAMSIDPSDGIHVVWVFSPGPTFNLLYRYKSFGREWSEPVTIPGSRASLGTAPHLVADSQRTLHLVWDCQDCRNYLGDIYYTSKPWAQGWTQPITLPVEPSAGSYRAMDLVLGQYDRLHLVWGEGNWDPAAGDTPRLKYARKIAGGAWTSPVLLAASFGGFMPISPVLVAAPDNRVYLFWVVSRETRTPTGYQYEYRVYYRRSDNGGQSWGAPVQITAWGSAWATHVPAVRADAQGRLHAVWTLPGVNANGNLWYSTSADLGLTWTEPAAISAESYLYDLALDEARNRLYVGAIGWVGEMPLHELTADYTLRQQVSIPADAHEATLSFLYRLAKTADTAEDQLEVLAGDTPIFTATARGKEWVHAWVDMDAWKGTAVEITFRMRNEAGGAKSWAYLDDISLAPWLTPVVRGVAPPRVQPRSAVPVTIQGENFVATPTVFVGTTPLTSVLWVDDRTLSATLPATLAPGIYEVWVKNPGGQEGVRVGALTVQGGCYLPSVSKGVAP